MGFFTAVSSLFHRQTIAPPVQTPSAPPSRGLQTWNYFGVEVVPMRTPGQQFAALLYIPSDHGKRLLGAVTGAKDLEELESRCKARVDACNGRTLQERADYHDFTHIPPQYGEDR